MFWLIKKIFVRLLIRIVNAFNHTKFVSLSNQNGAIQTIFINLCPNEYSHKFHYYSFTVKLDKFFGICNTFNGLSNKVNVLNKNESLNLSVFSMITGINESKTLTKQISCECKSKFDESKCNSNQWWNNGKC